MNEFVKKLIYRLEEELSNVNFEKATKEVNGSFYDGLAYAYGYSVGIALKLAEEYKGGWIPCSERLPDEEDYYLITMKYYHLHNPVVMGCNFEEGEWWNVEKDDEVIAWMPLPEPYKPKGDIHGTE